MVAAKHDQLMQSYILLPLHGDTKLIDERCKLMTVIYPVGEMPCIRKLRPQIHRLLMAAMSKSFEPSHK